MLEEFPRVHYALAWRWLDEAREQNFDDDGPRTFAAFVCEMDTRRARGESLWLVRDDDGRACGIIGYAPVSARYGWFHGICFTRAVHGRGIAARAVRAVLAHLFAAGVQKVSAGYFADNPAIDKFLRKLGAAPEGYLRAQTTRAGVPVDMRLVAFFPPA